MHSLAQSQEFPRALKFWRKHRKLSQLELSMDANVSQRHLSWLENGRSQPSREMVVRLTEVLDIPLRDRNEILKSAGFAELYTQRTLAEPEMDSLRGVLKDMLQHHSPYPALVLDRHWNVLMKNLAADQFLSSLISQETLNTFISEYGQLNLAILSLHPHGIRPYVSNWEAVGPLLFQRLKKEAASHQDPILGKLIGELEGYFDEQDLMSAYVADMLPVLPLQMRLGDQTLELCSVISTFGTAQDITANELKIETFYPANDASRRYFQAKAAT